MAFERETAALTDRLRWSLVAAAATPMRSDGQVDAGVCDRYFRHLVSNGADALAVAAHTGRGPHLPASAKAELVRLAGRTGVPVLAGVGAGELEWAEAAAAAGAEALLVFPPDPPEPADGAPGTASEPSAVGDLRDIDAVVAHHDAVWRASGLPLVAFDLYTRPYAPDVLDHLLEHPGVVAFKPARLYDAIACQRGIGAARSRGRLVLTGEDRMLGASLMWGAEGALLGIAAAAVQVTAALVDTFAAAVHTSARDAAARFIDVSAVVDELARVVFRPPYDGYVQRMLWIAADEGAVPEEYAVDLYRPADLDDTEREEVLRVVRLCREQVRK